MNDWVQTDEHEETVSAMEAFARFLVEAELRPNDSWRWAIISLHVGIQGLMVCSLSDSTHEYGLTEASRTKRLRALLKSRTDPQTKIPKQHLEFFDALYKKLQDPEIAKILQASVITPSEYLDRSLERLKKARDEFIHFKPKGWSIEVEWLREACSGVIGFAGILARGGYRDIRWSDLDEHPRRIETAITTAQKLLGVTCS